MVNSFNMLLGSNGFKGVFFRGCMNWLTQFAIPFVLSALVVIIITIVAERFGTKIGGIIGTLPTNIAVAFFFIAYNNGTGFAAEAAAFTRRYDCESLEQLMVAYGDTGEIEKATDVFHILQRHCQDYENYDRVLEYAEQNFGESGVVN